MTLQTQALTMLTMVCGGIYLGMAKETYDRFRGSWQKNATLNFILQITFWVMQTCLIFYLLYRVNFGELRIYVFLACGLGFALYQLFFKPLYRNLLEWVIRVIDMLVITPLVFVCKLIFSLLRILYQTVFFILKSIFKIVRFPIMILKKGVRKLIPKKVYIKVSQIGSFCSTIITNYKKSG